jgi:hypothetical protein
MRNKRKYIFLFFLLLLLLPEAKRRLGFIHSDPLNGAYTVPELPVASWTSWFRGQFQADYDKAYEQNVGFREDLVRLNNQLNYSLFNFTTAKSVVVGKNGYLMEQGYIDGCLGTDFVDSNWVRLRMLKTKYVQEELEKRGKHLLVILAPGKASFYKEFIPERFHPEKKRLTNYKLVSGMLNELNIDHIDFNGYFLAQKYKSPYPLYPKQGIHWSTYGAAIAMDSVLKYLRIREGIDLPQMKIRKVEWSDKLKDSDYDIGSGMNLIFQLPFDTMAYPEIEFEPDTHKFRPRVLTIGDSYYWQLVWLGLHHYSFKESDFWYYNKMDYNDNGSQRPISGADVPAAINEKDLIIIIQTEAFYSDIGMGFIDSAYEYLKK